MSGTTSLVLIALIFCLLVFRNQIRMYLVRCHQKTAEAALRDAGKCCGCSSSTVFACNNGIAKDSDISFKVPSSGRSFRNDDSSGRSYRDCDVNGLKKTSFFIYSDPLDIDECMSSNEDCDITYKNVRTSFEPFSKKVVSSMASNDDSNCIHIGHHKYEPTIEQDADDDPDNLA